MIRAARQQLEQNRPLAVLIEACRQSFAGSDPDRLARLAEGIDWTAVLALARRHRVEGLAASTLDSIPLGEVRDALRSDAQSIARDGLRGAAECERLRDAFAARGIAMLFVKGLTLGALAYRTPFLKMALDIDLLVAPAQIDEAAALLRELGYGPTIPARFDRVGRWHRRHKESAWVSGDAAHLVDLHSRLADNRRMIPRMTVASPRQSVEILPGIALPTLPRDELFGYLAVHGGSSNWFRLKWIVDFAALFHRCDAAELGSLISRATEQGAGRAPHQAVLLSAILFGGPFEQAASALRLENRSMARWLVASALRDLAAPREPIERRFGTVRMHATHLVLGSGPTYPVRELARKIGEQISRRT